MTAPNGEMLRCCWNCSTGLMREDPQTGEWACDRCGTRDWGDDPTSPPVVQGAPAEAVMDWPTWLLVAALAMSGAAVLWVCWQIGAWAAGGGR